jgi:hypothetical protein
MALPDPIALSQSGDSSCARRRALMNLFRPCNVSRSGNGKTSYADSAISSLTALNQLPLRPLRFDGRGPEKLQIAPLKSIFRYRAN